MSSTPNISLPNSAYTRQLDDYWYLVGDLMGGTKAMREAGERWLPREDRERNASYRARLSRSFLFNAFADTCRFISSKPFGRPMTISDPDASLEPVMELSNDCDGEGTTLHRFGKRCMEIGIAYGVVHGLPVFPPSEGETDNRAVETRSGIRPYITILHPLNLIAWQTGARPDGTTYLKSIKIRETSEDDDETLYTTTEVEQIRVITETDFSIWRRSYASSSDKSGAWEKVAEGTHTYGRVPIVSAYYGEWLTAVTATPPMLDLAYMNVEHWQSASDQRNILRFARAGTYFASGWDKAELERGIAVGANAVVGSTNPEAKLEVVEWDGDAIDAGANDLKSIEERMQVLGTKPFVRQSGNQTATARALDEGRSQTQVEEWIGVTEQFLVDCVRGALEWQNRDGLLSHEFSITLDRDFYIDLRSADDSRLLLEAADKNQISQKAFLREWKRRGMLEESLDIDEELETSQSEAMDKARMMSEVFGNDSDEGDE